MASKRIDELTTRSVVNTDLLPPTPTGGPSGSATVAATVKAGLVQPNSGTAGAGADVTIKAADGVTSGAGGNIILQVGAQATTGGDGRIIVRSPGTSDIGSIIPLPNHSVGVRVGSGGATGSFDIRRDISFSTSYTRIVDNGDFSGGNGSEIRSSGILMLMPDANNLGVNSAKAICAYRRAISVSYMHPSTSVNHAAAISGSLTHGVLQILNVSDEAGRTVDYTKGGSIAYIPATTNISTDQNDLALTATAFHRINCTSVSNLTGIAPPTSEYHVDGRMIKIFNVGTASLTLKHNSTSSSAANRMFSVSGSDIVLGTNDYAECVYDSTDNGSGAAGWRIA